MIKRCWSLRGGFNSGKGLLWAIGWLASAWITQAAAPTLNDWPFRQSLDVTAPGLVGLALPPETFDAAQASLADLRLIDPAARKCPT